MSRKIAINPLRIHNESRQGPDSCQPSFAPPTPAEAAFCTSLDQTWRGKKHHETSRNCACPCPHRTLASVVGPTKMIKRVTEYHGTAWDTCWIWSGVGAGPRFLLKPRPWDGILQRHQGSLAGNCEVRKLALLPSPPRKANERLRVQLLNPKSFN